MNLLTSLRGLRLFALAALLRLAFSPASQAAPGSNEDWPQYLGPTRDGWSKLHLQPAAWPAEGPKPLWKKTVGEGFSSPIFAQGRLFLHHRVEGREVVECFDPGTGKPVWSVGSKATYKDDFGFDEGPRATPAVDGDDLASLGADGEIQMLSAGTGKRRWSVSAQERFSARKGFFGFASSPLIFGDRVIICVGGEKGSGLVALNRMDGSLAWNADAGEAGYASPTIMGEGAAARIVLFNRAGLSLVHPAQGLIESAFPWRARSSASVNAASPVLVGERILITASYDTGAALLELPKSKGGKPRVVWSGDEALSAHYATPVLHEGLLYGIHGRQESGATLRCVEAGTGKVRWEKERFGSGTVIRTDEHLLVLHEKGELIVAPLSGAGFKPLARFQLLGSGVRATPALGGGMLFAKSPRELVALPLGPR